MAHASSILLSIHVNATTPPLDDDMLVELAVAGNVPYIVTSNLSDISPARELGIQVLTPGEFIRIIPPL